MDLASAVQFLLAFEASLKLAPGQKPPPPSPPLLFQLSAAVDAIKVEVLHKQQRSRFSGLPPSVWSDWPLCCGVDLTSEELQAARSLPPSLLRNRGLLSLFLAHNSCAEAMVYGSAFLAPIVLQTLPWLPSSEPDPVPFPSAHLAARVGHRLINADHTLDFIVDSCDSNIDTVWSYCDRMALGILARSSSDGPNLARSAVPHEAACLGLVKEAAAILEALSAAQRGPREIGVIRDGGLSRGLPFLMVMNLLCWIDEVLVRADEAAEGQPMRRDLRKEMYKEALALPDYDPLLLLQSFSQNIDSGLGRGSLNSKEWSRYLHDYRFLLWTPLACHAPLTKLRPADAYTAIRLGLEDLGRRRHIGDGWSVEFLSFASYALQSGLVQPELILRARPQLLEGLVEGLARKRVRGTRAPMRGVSVVSLLARSPAVGFHLKNFFSRSGFLQKIRDSLTPLDSRSGLIRLLVPLAAQSDIGPMLDLPTVLRLLVFMRDDIRDTTIDISTAPSCLIFDFVTQELTLDILREPRHAQPFLQYLMELAEEIAAPKRPHARYGVLMVVSLGKACIAFSDVIARALGDITGRGAVGPASKAEGGRGPGGPAAGVGHHAWRARLVGMARVLSLLRRRVLRELLPVAEAREAALWEGVREEEVVAALTEGA